MSLCQWDKDVAHIHSVLASETDGSVVPVTINIIVSKLSVPA